MCHCLAWCVFQQDYSCTICLRGCLRAGNTLLTCSAPKSLVLATAAGAQQLGGNPLSPHHRPRHRRQSKQTSLPMLNTKCSTHCCCCFKRTTWVMKNSTHATLGTVLGQASGS